MPPGIPVGTVFLSLVLPRWIIPCGGRIALATAAVVDRVDPVRPTGRGLIQQTKTRSDTLRNSAARRSSDPR